MGQALEIKSAIETASIKHDGVLFLILFAIVATVIITPLAVIDTPLLADYPNHVARMHIIGNVQDDLFLSSRYIIDFDFLPNIVMDLMVPWMMSMVPLDIAGRLFVAMCVVSTMASAAWLHRTLFNQWSPYSLLAALFAWHGSLIAGMVNFSLGIGLVPAALAVWIRLTDATALKRLLIGSVMALALFFCHLVAFGAYGLLVLGYALGRPYESRRDPDAPRCAIADLAIAGATAALPVFLLLRLAWRDGEGSAFSELVYGNATWKLKALLAPLANYDLPLDLLSFALVAGLALVAWRAGWLQIERRMVPGLVLLAAAFVLAPKALWTGGVFDQRLAVLLAPMLVACTRFTMSNGLIPRLMATLLTLLFLIRIGVLTSAWLDHRSDLAEMRRAIEMVAPGSRILVARRDERTAHRLAPRRHLVFHHAVQLASLPALAVIEKSAFVSTLYALPGQQPLVLKPPFDRLGGRGHADLPTFAELTSAYRPRKDDPPPRRQIQDWPLDFDYVVLIYGYGPGAEELVGGLPLEPLLDGDILDLFRIVRR